MYRNVIFFSAHIQKNIILEGVIGLKINLLWPLGYIFLLLVSTYVTSLLAC